MRFHTHAGIDAATERPHFTERGDLNATIFAPMSTTGLYLGGAIHINGTAAERREFLVRLAEAAVHAAAAVEDDDALTEVAS